MTWRGDEHEARKSWPGTVLDKHLPSTSVGRTVSYSDLVKELKSLGGHRRVTETLITTQRNWTIGLEVGWWWGLLQKRWREKKGLEWLQNMET